VNVSPFPFTEKSANNVNLAMGGGNPMYLTKMLLVVNPATVCREANSSRDQLTSEMTTAVRPPESDKRKASNIREASIIQGGQQQQQETTTRTLATAAKTIRTYRRQ
jgi:hypothetical protein